ncbi:MAG: PadR family transcriptional regulator [Clostridia bacterium]|nr:PadR family transcriptional regulator [Clostridia bacterium]
MTLFDSMKKGTVEVVVLSMLLESDMYGYQLVQEILKLTDGKYVLKEGALYPILYKLTEQNFVSTYTTYYGRRPRVYYHLEPAGVEYAKSIYNAYNELTQSVYAVTANKYN